MKDKKEGTTQHSSEEEPKTWASAPERPEKKAFGQDPLSML